MCRVKIMALTLFILGLSTGEASTGEPLTIWPDNLAATVSDVITLTCQAGDQSAISWVRCITRDDCTVISIGGKIVIPDPKGKYGVMETPEREFTLTVDSVEFVDGVKYKCQTTPLLSAYSEVIVMEPDMTCELNTTGGVLVEGNATSISCRVAFNGRWAPSMRCKIATSGWLYGVDESSAYFAMRKIELIPRHGMNSEQIYCEAYIEFPKVWEAMESDEATNVPVLDRPITWSSSGLVVLYGPRNTTISPKRARYQVGDTITCSSSANPEPSYIWTDVSSGLVLANAQNLELSSEFTGEFDVQCQASNIIQGVENVDSLTVEILVCNGESCAPECSTTLTIVIGVVLGVLFCSSLAVNVIFVILRRGNTTGENYRGDGKNQDKENKPPSKEAVPEITKCGKTMLSAEVRHNGLPHHATLSSTFYHVIDDDDVKSEIETYIDKLSGSNASSVYTLERKTGTQVKLPTKDQMTSGTEPRHAKPSNEKPGYPNEARANDVKDIMDPIGRNIGSRSPYKRRESSPALQTLDPEALSRVEASRRNFRDDSFFLYSRETRVTSPKPDSRPRGVPVNYVNEYELRRGYSDI